MAARSATEMTASALDGDDRILPSSCKWQTDGAPAVSLGVRNTAELRLPFASRNLYSSQSQGSLKVTSFDLFKKVSQPKLYFWVSINVYFVEPIQVILLDL